MTADDPRERIAAVLRNRWPAPWHGSDRQQQQVTALADAVIRELPEHRRLDLVRFASWLLFEEPGEGREEQLVDQYLTETTDG